ncbi:hypothetical protein [Thalassoroseus pseudoceratinae]|uniref:hypothetical protein n=1 Tax=Thalassoroseus pseudoceratinae TaxID=2713176 RepID=UPI001421668E|nr:hypothetical protein [Thalassoroseus pseudoceratinae]
MRILLGMLVLFSGCASARYVTKGEMEGVVAMPSDTDRNREKAEELMAQHFPEGYEIVFEEEAAVGSVTHVHKNSHGDDIHLAGGLQNYDHDDFASVTPRLPGLTHRTAHSDITMTTRDKTEWRIRYRKKRPNSLTAPGELPSESLQQHFEAIDANAEN